MRYLAILALLILTSCEGPVGPQGERGPQGPEGPAGQNITVLDLTFSNFEGVPGYIESTRSVPEITRDVIERGYVIAYLADDEGWRALPYAVSLYEGEYFTSMSYRYDVGTFTHEFQFTPPDADVSGYDADIRIVIVAP
jgi:hypothetical protein